MHSYWDKHQSPIKQLSGATNKGSATTTPLQNSCHICHHLLQVFIQQGDAPRWWLPVPAGPRLPGWTAPTAASVYAIREALSSESFKFHKFNTSFTSLTPGRAVFKLYLLIRYIAPQHSFCARLRAPQGCSSGPAA